MKKLLPLLALSALLSLPAFAQHEHHKHAVMQGEKPTAKSLYWLTSKWQTQTKQAFELKQLQGKTVVMAMIYTHCQAVCPLIMEDVKNIESKLSDTERAQTEFLIVTFDPKRDTPDVLAKYAQKHSVVKSNWHFIQGSESQVSELAALLGVRYQANAQGDFIHSNQITLLNQAGEVAYQRPDLKESLQIIQAKLKSLYKPVKHYHH
jgi:protein SCO1